ncbi:MAG: helix-turn-helix transcriptional regulator [Marmoricola sp.]|nr:helix-turn-helix transcriptional regulator [Marmoricola sp.]
MNESPAVRLSEIAATPGRLQDRGHALLTELRRHLPFDSAWLSLAEPQGTGYISVAGSSLDPSVETYLSGPQMARDIEVTGTNRDRAPLSPSDLPYPAEELETWADCLIPAGYHEALAVALYVPGRGHVGFMALLSGSSRRPDERARRDLAELAPVIARGVDPMRSLAAAARVVRGAEAGVVLYRDGATSRLPGLADDPLLADGSGVLSAARAAIRGGHAYTSFLWPRGGRHAPDGHVRVTVLSGTDDVPGVWVGTALLSPAEHLRGLTPRELEVLGLLIAGCGNLEIARALVVAPRTIASHVEHILHKLAAPTRTLAAVRAQRAGLYVPAGAAESGAA